MHVRPKKFLGQHFLKNDEICKRVAAALTKQNDCKTLIEIGPGTGALTKHLLSSDLDLFLVEIDRDSIEFLEKNFPDLKTKIIAQDFLTLDLSQNFSPPIIIIGNFPYNISTQILFRLLKFRDIVPELVGMFQKEVAIRITSGPGNKDYGILSVFIQAFYNTEYLFTVDETEFIPPPKVKSGVIRLVRNKVKTLPCDEELFFRVVKAGFNQRRKTLRNSLKQFSSEKVDWTDAIFNQRPERLHVEDFIRLTEMFSQK